MSAPLDDLIERLEKATGPDRELDRDISRPMERLPTRPFVGPSAWDMHRGMYWIIGSEDTPEGPAEKKWGKTAPKYTSSIDAALTLAPEGAEIEIHNLYGIAVAKVGLNFNDGPECGEHRGGSLPIALCIAALKSRMTAPPNDAGGPS